MSPFFVKFPFWMVEGLCVFQAQAEGSRGCELHSVLVLHLGELE
jgi:hypothetical protein